MRQPSSTRTSSTVSSLGAWPSALERTCAVAASSVTVIVPMLIRGSWTSSKPFSSATSQVRPTCSTVSISCGARMPVAERRVVAVGGRALELGQRGADPLLVGGAALAAARERRRGQDEEDEAESPRAGA